MDKRLKSNIMFLLIFRLRKHKWSMKKEDVCKILPLFVRRMKILDQMVEW